MSSESAGGKLGTFQRLVSTMGLAQGVRLSLDYLRGRPVPFSPVHMTIGGCELVIRQGTPDLEVARLTLEEGEFDEFPGDLGPVEEGLIIDAGGYIGTAALALALRFPGCTVVTVEANAENFRILERNVRRNPLIRPVHAALAPGSGMYTLKDRGTGDVGFSIVDQPQDSLDAVTIGEVQGITIPDILRMTGRSHVDVLKIDIEGGEAEVFLACAPWIDSVRCIVAEIHDTIDPRCSTAFTQATAGMAHWELDAGEKVGAYRPYVD